MADPKTVKIAVTNAGRGPRTLFSTGPTGGPVILRPGERFEGEVLEADARDFSADLVPDGEEGGELGGASTASLYNFPSLEGLNRDQLLRVAEDEGYPVMSADATEDAIREAIEASREATSQALATAIADLKTEKVADLRKIAANEGVAVEGDDNKADLALKIAQARLAKGE
jgi:hypothetical protein